MATYRDAGVNRDAADALVDRIRPVVTKTWHEGVVGGFGGFAAGIEIPAGYDDPVLMLTTDGVGTKAALARDAGRLDGLGWDLVAMCVDDLAATGATPIAMTDYLAVGTIDPVREERLVSSIATACAAAGVALLGGETAEHPGVMGAGDFDLAGAALGVVERGREIDGTAIVPGDVVVGVASPNLRSNGFSLVRATLVAALGLDGEVPGTGHSVAEVVAEPSVIYSPFVTGLVVSATVHGLAHITGGGLPTNLGRILPAGCEAHLDATSWECPAVFDAVAATGGVETEEMFRTFNMGIGFVVVTPLSDAATVLRAAGAAAHRAWIIGEVVAGDGAVHIDA